MHVTPVTASDHAEVGQFAAAVQAATSENVEVACVDQGYTEQRAEEATAVHGIGLEMVKPPDAKHGFVLLPQRWIVERFLAWAIRCHRLIKDYERLPEILAEPHTVAFACLMLAKVAAVHGPQHA